MLWLALHFPLWPLEAQTRLPSPSAIVVQGRILLADAAAQAAGLRPGQARATALGLLPTVRLLERDHEAEARARHDLACWAGRYTPTVSLAPPDELLLEIGGCLRLFGGLEALCSGLVHNCITLGYTVDWAVAPTPLGARWLARGQPHACITDPAQLAVALDALPCAVTRWPEATLRRLADFGVQRLGELRTLPSQGLRERLGQGAWQAWSQADGTLPDPQPNFIFPETFRQRLELPARIEQAEALVFAGQRLLAALSGWLHARQKRLHDCSFHLFGETPEPLLLTLRFGEACADEARFVRLLREHLGRLQLPGPIEAIELQAGTLSELSGDSQALFDRASAGEGAQACLSRLQARLGPAAVQHLAARADHRPEVASVLRSLDSMGTLRTNLSAGVSSENLRSTAQNEAFSPNDPAYRPLCLLPEPRLLREQHGIPLWHGPLQLLSGAERIESGWWDGGEAEAAGDVRRDYFIAQSAQGETVWIFRDRQGWFLHGLFA